MPHIDCIESNHLSLNYAFSTAPSKSSKNHACIYSISRDYSLRFSELVHYNSSLDIVLSAWRARDNWPMIPRWCSCFGTTLLAWFRRSSETKRATMSTRPARDLLVNNPSRSNDHCHNRPSANNHGYSRPIVLRCWLCHFGCCSLPTRSERVRCQPARESHRCGSNWVLDFWLPCHSPDRDTTLSMDSTQQMLWDRSGDTFRNIIITKLIH